MQRVYVAVRSVKGGSGNDVRVGSLFPEFGLDGGFVLTHINFRFTRFSGMCRSGNSGGGGRVLGVSGVSGRNGLSLLRLFC